MPNNKICNKMEIIKAMYEIKQEGEVMCILIAEDDQRLAQSLQNVLSDAQFESVCVSDGNEVLQEALRNSYELILLDVMLPNRSGFSVARELRRLRDQTPILMLTGLDSISNKIEGLDAGADDYMTKPFSYDELLARIRALLRRSSAGQKKDLRFGDLAYHPDRATLTCNEQEIRLNFKEAEIIKLFLSTPQSIISKEELIHKVWGYASSTSDNNVEAYISFLRKKLNLLESRVSIIAIKKQGYKLDAPT